MCLLADGQTSKSRSDEILRLSLIGLLKSLITAEFATSATFGRSYPANPIQMALKWTDVKRLPFVAEHESTALWTASEMAEMALSMPTLDLS